MKLARVLGTVVATQKYRDLEGIKFLVVQPLNEDLQPDGLTQVAADATAQSAPGELVFMVASREAAQALPETFVPVDLAITGIVDQVLGQIQQRCRTIRRIGVARNVYR